MAEYYTYVYYDESWQAYYVGKGQGGRMYAPKDHPELPPKERIQVFHFDEEWQAWECEIELIAFWQRQCDGGSLLNKSTGGKGGTTGCLGELNPMYGKKHSAESRSKISAAMTGKKNYFFGKELSTQHRNNIAASQTGEKNHNYGKKASAETRAKMSSSHSGEKNHNYGKKHSPEARAKMSAARKQYWANKKAS